MTIRIATATTGSSSVIARRLCASVPLSPDNDNGPAGRDDHLLWEALRHFGEHGLHAALMAADSAQAALDAGDPDGFEWWLSICRKLDRPLADSLARLAAAAV